MRLMAAVIRLMTRPMRLEAAVIRLTTRVIRLMVAIIRLMNAVIKLMTRVIRLMVAAIRLMTRVIRLMVAIIRLMTRVIRLMIAVIKLTTRVIRLMIAIIRLMTWPMRLEAAVIRLMTRPMRLMAAVLRLGTPVLRLACTPLQLASPCAALMAQPDSKRRPIMTLADEAFDDEAAPISEPRPSSPAADPGILGKTAPSNDTAAPLPPDSAPVVVVTPGVAVTRELTYAFLAKKATRDRIREVVEHRVPKGTQEANVNDIIQEVNVRAMETTSLAETVAGMRPWISRVAQNHVIDHYRGEAKHLRWLNPSVDVQELPPDAAAEGDDVELPAEDPTAPPRPIEQVDKRMLGPWLHDHVETKAEKLTLEMIKQKAVTGQSNAQVAAEFGMTEGAFDQRVYRFKAKWIPKWKKHKRDQALVIVLVALLLGAALWWLFHGKAHEEARPTAVPVLAPAPTASVVPEQFNNADPTQDEQGKKPRRPNP